MAAMRVLLRLPCLVLVLSLAAVTAVCLQITEGVSRRPINRTPAARACFRACCWCLGLRIMASGQVPEGPVLMLSNHVSWTDIPVMGGLSGVRFLSKAEVANWPFIGWLARQAGTLFIKRGGGEAPKRRADITASLQSGQSVHVFPEGTTSSGLTVLPFFPRLIGAAAAAGVPVVPVSIAYLRDNDPCHVVPFIGDDEFHHHLLKLLAASPPSVRVTWHAAVMPGPDESTRELSARVREIILEGVRQSHQDAVKGSPAATSSSDASRTPMISRSK